MRPTLASPALRTPRALARGAAGSRSAQSVAASTTMRRETPGRLLVGLALLNAAMIAVGAIAIAPVEQPEGDGVRVGLVFDIGGMNVLAFIESAWRWLERAMAERGVYVEYIEPTEGADLVTA